MVLVSRLCALPLRFSSVCRPEVEEGRRRSPKLFPPEGEVGGWRREAENLEASDEDSSVGTG